MQQLEQQEQEQQGQSSEQQEEERVQQPPVALTDQNHSEQPLRQSGAANGSGALTGLRARLAAALEAAGGAVG